MSLKIGSEPYSPYGNMSAEGVIKSLGAPTLDRLRVLLRETVQNADDARIINGDTPKFKIEIRTLTDRQSQFLREQVLVDCPEQDPGFALIQSSITKSRLRVLEISDWGTSGLGGPTRANEKYEGSEATDFIDFIRNIGSPRDTEFGGGTYGYGKSSLWLNSCCGTICLHTLTEFMGQPVERFMASRIGAPFEDDMKKYTGRHWWGRLEEDDIVDPIEGAEAGDYASNLGMLSRSSELRCDRGTTLMIIDPDLGGRTPEQVCNLFRESLMWFFWPKMLPENHSALMDFSVRHQGEALPMPTPSDYPPLELMMNSYRRVLDSGNDACHSITYGKAKEKLGRISLEKGLTQERNSWDTGDSDDEHLIPEHSCHIALMRKWGGIVKYLEGPPMPDGLVEYGGIFVTDQNSDDVFAQSEPPAHDDWIADSLTGKDKGYVKTALRKISEYLNENVLPQGRGQGSGDSTRLAPLAEKLGGLLLGAGASLGNSKSASQKKSSVRAGAKRGQLKVSRPVAGDFQDINGVACRMFSFSISGDDDTECQIKAVPKILLDDGPSDPVEGQEPPKIKRWITPQGTNNYSGDGPVKYEGRPGEYEVAVSLPSECAIQLLVSIE